jgi:predicted phosphate transport protein (TIGR00153 family)
MTERVKHAADALVSMMDDDPNNFEAHTKRIKDAEHGADELTHRITTKLNKSFITPFDREDIYMLSVALDDVIDYIDAGARAIRMYNIVEINDHARAFARVIQSLTVELHSAISMLQAPKDMNKHIVEIHRLENEADEIYFRSIGELFSNSTDPVKLIKWKELYEILEAATDRCESVANIIESIILKHN